MNYRFQIADCRLLIIIFLSFFIFHSSFVIAQNVPDSVFNYTFEQLQASRDSVRILNRIRNLQDSILSNQNNIINNYSIEYSNQEKELKILKDYLNKHRNEAGFISFNGFYAGLTAAYQFNDTILTKQTVLNGTIYDVTGNFKFTMKGNIDISGIIGFPLRNEKFYLKAAIEYKLF